MSETSEDHRDEASTRVGRVARPPSYLAALECPVPVRTLQETP